MDNFNIQKKYKCYFGRLFFVSGFILLYLSCNFLTDKFLLLYERHTLAFPHAWPAVAIGGGGGAAVLL